MHFLSVRDNDQQIKHLVVNRPHKTEKENTSEFNKQDLVLITYENVSSNYTCIIDIVFEPKSYTHYFRFIMHCVLWEILVYNTCLYYFYIDHHEFIKIKILSIQIDPIGSIWSIDPIGSI